MVRGYSKNQAREMGFPCDRYQFPTVAGKGTGVLAMKVWDNKCLICYFDMDDGEKIKLVALREHENDWSFRPNHFNKDMALVEIGSLMEISYKITKTGLSSLLNAKTQE